MWRFGGGMAMTFDEIDGGSFLAAIEDSAIVSASLPTIPHEERLVVALDYATSAEAWSMVRKLGDDVSFYKIGLELAFSGGIELGKELVQIKKKVFFDMKLLDIGNTVEKAVRNAGKLGFEFITVHGLDRKTMDAAVRGKKDSNIRLLAVTVLTNLDQYDLDEQGIRETSSALVVRRAQMALDAGFDGVIASGHEAEAIRRSTIKRKSNFIIKTPGIRPTGSSHGDQNRVMTPTAAIEAGADYLVVGRPIIESSDPAATARSIIAEIAAARPRRRSVA
jgi:orotidine-5'-phosphate decarboxylase